MCSFAKVQALHQIHSKHSEQRPLQRSHNVTKHRMLATDRWPFAIMVIRVHCIQVRSFARAGVNRLSVGVFGSSDQRHYLHQIPKLHAEDCPWCVQTGQMAGPFWVTRSQAACDIQEVEYGCTLLVAPQSGANSAALHVCKCRVQSSMLIHLLANRSESLPSNSLASCSLQATARST